MATGLFYTSIHPVLISWYSLFIGFLRFPFTYPNGSHGMDSYISIVLPSTRQYRQDCIHSSALISSNKLLRAFPR